MHDLTRGDERRALRATHPELDEPPGADAASDRAGGSGGGLHELNGTQLYVSRGTGFWGPPMRLFAPAEITELTLRSG